MPNHIPNVFNDLDLTNFIRLNIFQQDSSNLMEVKNFFSHFIHDKETY